MTHCIISIPLWNVLLEKAMTQEPSGLLEVTVTDLTSSGAGLARGPDGRVLFIPFSAPGDHLRVRVTSQEKRYAEAEIIEILEPSAERANPPCAVFGKCGGCQWQHIPYARQWQTKVRGLRHTLERRQITAPEPIGELPAARIWEYRNRIQLRGHGRQLGFFARSSQALVPVDRCEIARPELNAALAETRTEGARLPRPFKVELEVLEDGTVRRTWNAGHAARGFRQIHDEQNTLLQKWVTDAISPGRTVYDLFGGSGNFAQLLAQTAQTVHCVDTSALAGTEGKVRFHRGGVFPWLLKQPAPAPGAAPASAVVDPPREGLGPDFPEIEASLRRLGVNEVVAVGCDANAWAHDVSRFLKKGWRLERVAALDLFPQTPHLEALALLRIDTTQCPP